MTTKMPVVIPVIGATVGGLAVLSYLLRKRIESKFGYHDEKDEEDVRGKIVVITGASAGKVTIQTLVTFPCVTFMKLSLNI